MPRPTVVTFDAGQTLIELDLDFLAKRVAMCDVVVDPDALRGAEPAAWRHYDVLVARGELDHPALWRALMQYELSAAGASGDLVAAAAWLYEQQPVANVFRRPIPGMVELARELATRGVRVGVVSNSEGALADLLAEIGLADAFEMIVDSGRLGIAKPDPRIFEHALAQLGVRDGECVHVGDSWSADVQGALAAGWRAVWFGRTAKPVDDPRVATARDVGELRAVLGV